MIMIATVPTSPSLADDEFAQAVAVARQGERKRAHTLLARVTRATPENVNAWLWRAGTAATREEALLCLSEALRLDPAHVKARQALRELLRAELDKDVFLAYGSEDDWLYYIRTGSGIPTAVPKDRAVPELYPPPRHAPLHAAERWLAFAALGLIPAGLGALLCAPIAAAHAWRAARRSLSPVEARWRLVVLALALTLWLLGGLLGWLFILHF